MNAWRMFTRIDDPDGVYFKLDWRERVGEWGWRICAHMSLREWKRVTEVQR
jgi:hypothetical protein